MNAIAQFLVLFCLSSTTALAAPPKDDVITTIPYCLWENRGPNEMTVSFLQAPQSLPSQREIVLRAVAQRPDDPWPRGWPTSCSPSPAANSPRKGYHEPGGSFSPAVGSFGVSIWVRDSAGNLKTTSDGLPMKQLSSDSAGPTRKAFRPSATDTPHYKATWAVRPIGTTTLDLQPRGDR